MANSLTKTKLFLLIRLNRRGEYLSIRDPEWWIQWDNSPWRNPYARWGSEHVTSLYEERYIRPEFVVSVDTSHPSVRSVLEGGLNRAEDLLDEKASFAIEVSVASLSDLCNSLGMNLLFLRFHPETEKLTLYAMRKSPVAFFYLIYHTPGHTSGFAPGVNNMKLS